MVKKWESSRTAVSTSSLIKNPPKGGIPLIENTRNAKISPLKGFLAFSSEKFDRWVFARPLLSRVNHLRKELIIYTAR